MNQFSVPRETVANVERSPLNAATLAPWLASLKQRGIEVIEEPEEIPEITAADLGLR